MNNVIRRCGPSHTPQPPALTVAARPLLAALPLRAPTPTREMKFGKTLEDEMRASGVFGEALPWIDYGCVPAATSPRRRLAHALFFFPLIRTRTTSPPSVA